MAEVIAKGYAPDLDDVEIEFLGRDPFLVAAALGLALAGSWQRGKCQSLGRGAKRKVPKCMRDLGIKWINDYDLWRVLDFRIRSA